MTITPELATVIADAIEDRLIDLHVSLPGTIQSYDASTQTAVVELGLNRLLEKDDKTITSEALPVLQNVRVIFPRSANFFLSFPLAAGDTGDVIFSEASIGQWLATGKVSDPEDIGRCTLSGAKFYPGLVPDSAVLTDDLTNDAILGETGGTQLRVKSGTVEATTGGATTAADFVSMATKIDTIIATLDGVFRGWVVLGGDGGAALKSAYLAAFATPPTSTASTNLKAD